MPSSFDDIDDDDECDGGASCVRIVGEEFLVLRKCEPELRSMCAQYRKGSHARKLFCKTLHRVRRASYVAMFKLNGALREREAEDKRLAKLACKLKA